MPARRIRSVDVARGIAMICIVLGHLGHMPLIKVTFTFHVPLFFFITGYFISDRQGLGAFVKGRARTLLVPYAITCAAMIALAALQGWLGGGAADAGRAAKEWLFAALYGAGDSYTEPFPIKAIGALWFLWATFWGACLLRCLLGLKPWLRLAAVAALFAAGYVSSRRLFWFPLSVQAGCCAVLFMYIGWCLRRGMEQLQKLPREVVAAWTLLALWVWISFMRDFKTFWLVHCDIGRGAVDVFGCVCGSWCVLMLSKGIDRVKGLGAALAYLGKYSLLMLCVHILELNLLPWWQVTGWLIGMGLPEGYELYYTIAGKLILDIGLTVILSLLPPVRRAMGFREERGKSGE